MKFEQRDSTKQTGVSLKSMMQKPKSELSPAAQFFHDVKPGQVIMLQNEFQKQCPHVMKLIAYDTRTTDRRYFHGCKECGKVEIKKVKLA